MKAVQAMASDEETGGEAVLRFFANRTGRRVFGLPGSSSVPIFHEMVRADVDFVASVQENAAVAMADGHSRFAGPTAVLLYMMPGAATAASNLYNAYRDGSPLVVVVSQQAAYARWGQGSVGEADIAEFLRPVTRFAREVTHRDQLVPILEAAYRVAAGPPSGPAVVVVPEDLLRAAGPVVGSYPERRRIPGAATDLAPVTERLVSARRPLIIVGGAVRRSGGSEAVHELATRHAIPIMYEPFWNDRLGADAEHPATLGQVTERSSAVREADLVLALGCRLFNEVHPRRTPWFAEDAFVVQVNSDGDALEQTFAVDWSCAADPGVFVRQLLDSETKPDPDVLNDRESRLDRLRQRRKIVRVGPYSEVATVLAGCTSNSFLVDESVLGNVPIMTAMAGGVSERYVSTTGGSLGWAIGCASGIALATGDRVVCVTGDGAFFFGLQGLVPAVEHRLPITYVVLDNGGFGSTRWFEDEYAKTRSSEGHGDSTYTGSDFAESRSVVRTAAGFGVPAHDVAAGELARLLAQPHDGPVLYRVRIDGT
jgi:thiamine pyrophosphate-dependent acetolactate synthase large subunit-like protein